MKITYYQYPSAMGGEILYDITLIQAQELLCLHGGEAWTEYLDSDGGVIEARDICCKQGNT